MSEYSSLKATIDANIKANNNQEITGSITNSVLNAMVDSLGAGYQYMGLATPTNPGIAQNPDYKCFYLATTPGTYTNLGGLVVADGEVAILKYDTSWTKEVTGIATAESVSQLGQKFGYTIDANVVEAQTYVKIETPILEGAKILSLGGYRDVVRGKTNIEDSQYFTIEVGSVADRDINYVYGRTAADIKITIDGLIYNVAYRDVADAVAPVITITTTDTVAYYRLPFTIKAGGILVSRTGTGQIYGKNTLEDANADGIYPNVTIGRDINYIRIAEVGTFSLQFSGIKSKTDELKNNVQSINDSILYPQEYTGTINTSTGSWSRSTGKCYIISVGEGSEIAINKKAGVVNFTYAFLTDYDIPNNIISYVEGTSFVVSGYSTEIKVPVTAKYLYVGPVGAVDSIIIDGVDIFKGVGNHLIELYKEDDLLSKFNLKGTETIEELTNLSTIDGFVDSVKGLIVSGNYKTTEAIAVKKGDVLVFSAFGTTNTTLISEKLGNFYQPLLIDTGYKERRFVFEKDGDIVISNSINYKLKAFIIRCNKELSISKNIFIPGHSFDLRNAGDNGELTISGARWISSFLPVDNKKSHYLDCNINFVNNSQGAVYQIQCYDVNGAYLGLANVRGVNYSGSNLFPPILIPYNNCRYIRVNIDGRAFPYTDRDKVVLSYSNDGIAFEPHNIISDKELFIKDSQRFNVNDLEQFASNIVSGTLSGSTFTNVDGIVETPDISKVYYDTSSNIIYKYSDNTFSSLGIYDRSSKVFNTSFKFFVYAGTENMKNMIVTASARYLGDNKPTIEFKLVRNAYYQTYWGSLKFNLCGNTYTKKEWRIPPTIKYMECIEVDITIPSGTIVFIKELENYFSDKVKQWNGGFRLNGHHLCCPDQSIQYFELCAKLGYPCVITIPKVTSDGVFVCYHDDDNIGRYARNADGTAIANPQPISNYTYNELLSFDFGISEGLQYAGTKIAKVEDFFRICAKTGMHPMFSIHPNLTNEQWAEIKDMAKKYGVLGNLNLKFASKTFMSDVYGIFGTDVESYTLDVSSNGYPDPSVAISDVNAVGFDTSRVRVGIEYFENIITKQLVEDTLAAGYFAACAEFSNNATSERYEEVMSWGATEITDDYNPCYGLNW